MITDPEGMQFLQWCLPRLGLHWPGFRKIRGRVYKRLKRRLHELGLPNLEAYRTYLADHAEEWAMLSTLCWMPITRFYRDRGVFQHLETEILPELAQLITKDRTEELRVGARDVPAAKSRFRSRFSGSIDWPDDIRQSSFMW